MKIFNPHKESNKTHKEKKLFTSNKVFRNHKIRAHKNVAAAGSAIPEE